MPVVVWEEEEEERRGEDRRMADIVTGEIIYAFFFIKIDENQKWRF